MAHCVICGRGRSIGNNISHANNKTKRVIMPNLQRVRVMTDSGVKRLYVCTRCLRSGMIRKAVR
ncbi:MAG: 50S ribosomal protein L28 [Nitrospira sp.]|nr:50S ribosomal protein L28 [Nitrospira sp.]